MANLSFEQSRHLVERTGYGPELEKIYRLQQMGRDQAINSLLSTPRDYLTRPPKLSTFDTFQQMRSNKQKQEAMKIFRKEVNNVKKWGLRNIIDNPNALQERMTWFWHNHFTSSHNKSRRTLHLLINQDLAIRKNAIGNFGELLRNISYEPMMLMYLDGVSNKKGKPNENFARELLELFTLGEGHYTERDIKEVARAFTGWTINYKTLRPRLKKNQVDTSSKVIFNQTGNFSSDDVLNMLLQHPRTAEYIAEKFWKEFINLESPDQATIKNWAHQFRSSNYDIATLLRAVLASPAFWSNNNRGKLIKSPLDLTIGAIRSLDLEDKNLPEKSILTELKRMGQDLYTPPNVKGWVGGSAWIDDTSLPIRQQFLRKLVRGSGGQQAQSEMKMSMQKQNRAMPAMDMPSLPQHQWANWLLPVNAITPIEQTSPRSRLQAILLDPAYQLK